MTEKSSIDPEVGETISVLHSSHLVHQDMRTWKIRSRTFQDLATLEQRKEGSVVNYMLRPVVWRLTQDEMQQMVEELSSLLAEQDDHD